MNAPFSGIRSMSLDPLPDGEIAAVVTMLEMLEPPRIPVPGSNLRLVRIDPGPEDYRDLFRRVGARWLWYSRLLIDDRELASILSDPATEVHEVRGPDGDRLGMVELDLRDTGQCRIAFLGLVPELAGKGHGRWLMAQVLRLAWRDGIRRVHVHTCSLDHPAALPSYLAAGFTAVGRAIERFVDPRLLGALPADCAPQVPLVGTLGSSRSPDS